MPITQIVLESVIFIQNENKFPSVSWFETNYKYFEHVYWDEMTS